MQTWRGSSTQPTTLPRAFRLRSSSARPRCRGSDLVRRRPSIASSCQQRPSSTASDRAGASPLSHARLGSAGTGTRQSQPGADRTSATNPAATRASARRPCSFQPRTIARAQSSYTMAERASTKASLLPEHSAQRRTGHGPGEPQRSHVGGARRVSDSRHGLQRSWAGDSQIAQRFGRSSASPRTPRR
jgi:hypothetical protein